jgi:hypothetical protein
MNDAPGSLVGRNFPDQSVSLFRNKQLAIPVWHPDLTDPSFWSIDVIFYLYSFLPLLYFLSPARKQQLHHGTCFRSDSSIFSMELAKQRSLLFSCHKRCKLLDINWCQAIAAACGLHFQVRDCNAYSANNMQQAARVKQRILSDSVNVLTSCSTISLLKSSPA